MIFRIKGTKKFHEQLKEFDKKSKRIIENKLNLLKQNPYRFKKLHSKKIKLFRIQIKIQNRETRLVYSVIEPNIILLCFIDRKKDYRDLENLIKEYRIK